MSYLEIISLGKSNIVNNNIDEISDKVILFILNLSRAIKMKKLLLYILYPSGGKCSIIFKETCFFDRSRNGKFYFHI